MISLKHISTLSVFNQTKFSADSTDSSYFLGSDQTQIFQGTPDVKYNDLCYIKCSNLQYTHGHLYGSTEVGETHVSLTQEEYDALSEEEKNNGKIYLIKESTIPDLIDQLPIATTSDKGLMSASDKTKLELFDILGITSSRNTGTKAICRISNIKDSIPVVGILTLSGIYENGEYGTIILSLCGGHNTLNMQVIGKSSSGLFSKSGIVTYGIEEQGVFKQKIKIFINFGSATYTGRIDAQFIGQGKLTILL